MDALDELEKIVRFDRPRAERARAIASLIRDARSYRWVGLYDVTATHISAIAWSGSEPPAYPIFPVTQGLSGAAVADGHPVIVQDVTKDPRYLTAFGSTQSEAIFPIAAGGHIVGTLDVESDRVNAFGVDDETFLSECARLLELLWR